MITVRFSTGFSIQYNDANFAQRSHDGGYADLYTKEKGILIAQVPLSNCVIEWIAPCRMYQGVPAESGALLALAKEIRSLKRKVTA